MFSASRGPAVAFIMVIFVTIYSLFRFRVSDSDSGQKTQNSTWFYLFGMLAVLLYLVVASDMDIFLFDRFSMFYENRSGGGAEERDFLYANAWADFLESPLFGNSYVVSIGAASPHNVFLESLMAVGLLGTAFFSIVLLRAFAALWKLINGSMGQFGYTLALSALCLMILGLTSYSIGQSPDLWIFVALITLISGSSRSRATFAPKQAYSA